MNLLFHLVFYSQRSSDDTEKSSIPCPCAVKTEEESYVYKPKTDKPVINDIDSLTFTPNESLNEPKDNPPKKESNIGWIVGIAVCAVVIVVLVIIIVILVIRNRKSNHKSASAKDGEL